MSSLLSPLSLRLCLYLHAVRVFSLPFLTTSFANNLDTPFGLPRYDVLVAPLPPRLFPDVLNLRPFKLQLVRTLLHDTLRKKPWHAALVALVWALAISSLGWWYLVLVVRLSSVLCSNFYNLSQRLLSLLFFRAVVLFVFFWVSINFSFSFLDMIYAPTCPQQTPSPPQLSPPEVIGVLFLVSPSVIAFRP